MNRDTKIGTVVFAGRSLKTHLKLFASASAIASSMILPAQVLAAEEDIDIDEIVVVGSSIRKSAAALDMGSQPIELVTDRQFKITSAKSIADYLRRLPLNTGESDSPTTDEYGGGNSSINLRGVGDQYTLVTVNGRRFGGEDTPDIGAIPTEAIESVQILKGGASAIYGSDAVAGVVNIKLKEQFKGIEVNTSYGNTTRTDAASFRTTAVFGLTEDKFSFTGSVAYQERGGIQKQDRELTASRDYRAFGGRDRRSSFVGNPHQIFTFGGDQLSLDLSQFQVGETGATAADYVDFDRETQAVSTNELGTYPESNRISAHWNTTYELVEDKLTFFSYGYGDRRHQEFLANQPIVDVIVPVDNPYNPFGQPVQAVYFFGPNESAPMTETFDTTNVQVTTGFNGTIEGINYEIAYSHYQKDISEKYENDIDVNAAQAAAERTDSTAFNPFGYWANSAVQLDGLSPTSRYNSQNKVRTIDAKINGDLFEWSAGTVKFAAGYEHRDVSFDFEPDESWQNAEYWWLGGPVSPTSGSRKVDAFFGELNVPLYENTDEGALVTSAEITGAVRNEKYSDYGSSTVSQFSGRVSFLDDTVALRASYAESFKAPSVNALNRPTRTSVEAGGFYFDPVRDGFLPVTRITGGNTGLDAEKGETINVGVVYRPDSDSNLLFKIDYWNLNISNIIVSPDGQSLLDGTATSGAITRDPITQMPTLDLRLDNGGTRKAAGFDIGAYYQIPTDEWGTFSFDLNATYLTKFEDSGDDVVVKYLDTWSSQVGPIPKLRAVLATQWNYGNWDFANIVHYSGGYEDELVGVVTRRVKAYVTADLQASYYFDEDSALGGLQLYGGLENIFNADLPFVAESSDGWDRAIADYRGRFFYIGARKKF